MVLEDDSRLRMLSLYSGAGGLDIGFMKAGFVPVFAVDNDPAAVDTYNASYGRYARHFEHLVGHEHVCVLGDAAEQVYHLRTLDVDVVVGGPPCQGFSIAGKMDPNDPRSRHVWLFLEAVNAVRPAVFVMENVNALSTNSRWKPLLYGLQDKAAEIGYSTHALVLNAADYGVPQARKRMFLVGTLPSFSFAAPPPTTAAENYVTVRDVLSSLPPFGSKGNENTCPAKVVSLKKPSLRKSPYAGRLLHGARPLGLDFPSQTLPAVMGGNLTPVVDQKHLDGEDACWITQYHEHLTQGGTPAETMPQRLRRLTRREAAALQDFPDDMEWRGSNTAIYRQIGNAVPPGLGYAVASAVRETLEGTSTPISPVGVNLKEGTMFG